MIPEIESTMNNTINKISGLLKLTNYKLKDKILMLIFSCVIVLVLFLSIPGFYFMHKELVTNTYAHLDEMANLKSREVEGLLVNYEKELISISNTDKFQEALNAFKTNFKLLKSERSDLFYMDSLKTTQINLGKYYSEVLAINSPITGNSISNYLPENDMTLVYQYLYIYMNPNEQESKYKYLKSNDNSSYSTTHATYQPYFLELLMKLHAKNIYLIDPLSGNVVYSAAKNIDFATNLFDGPFRKSPLSTAFRQAMATTRQESFFVDFESYIPTCDKPASFISVPVYSSNEIIGVMVLQFDTKLFNDVLFDEFMLASEGSFDYSIIGPDHYLRNDPCKFVADGSKYLKTLKRHAKRNELSTLSKIEKTGSMAMLSQYPKDIKGWLNNFENAKITDNIGQPVFVSIKKLNIPGNNLFLVAKINSSEVSVIFYQHFWILIFLVFVVVGLILVAGRIFGNALSNRIKNLSNSILMLYKGEMSDMLEIGSTDELGESVDAFNNLRNRITAASEFALEMSDSNFNHEFVTFSENDNLGKSLNILKDKMIKAQEEHGLRMKDDETRNWINTGIALFNDLLRQNNNNINALSYSLIEKMVEYLNANQGGIFLVEGNSEENKQIVMAAGFAYDRRKYLNKTLEIKEGLLGTCYFEKQSIYLKEIPQDYLEITSGLGQGSPKCLYIAPLKIDNDVIGMIEIASFNEFDKYQIDFIDKVSESIAATFVSVKLNMQTVRLLDESNRKAEEIAQQEEEMRQNLEEMQATQEELSRLRQDDEKKTKDMQVKIDSARQLLKNLLDSIPGGYNIKDQNGVIMVINTEGAEFFGLSATAARGKTDHELMGSKLHEIEHKIDLEVLDSGEKEYEEEKEIKGILKRFRVIKKPFFIDNIHQKGILTIRHLITD
jgi:PAS domain S-box-containing protein